jgi:hypothetical protein
MTLCQCAIGSRRFDITYCHLQGSSWAFDRWVGGFTLPRNVEIRLSNNAVSHPGRTEQSFLHLKGVSLQQINDTKRISWYEFGSDGTNPSGGPSHHVWGTAWFRLYTKKANKHTHFALDYTLMITLQHFYCFRHSAPSVRGLLTFWIHVSLLFSFSLTSSAAILGLPVWRIVETTDHHSCNCSKCGNHFHSKSKFCELFAPCRAGKEITI